MFPSRQRSLRFKFSPIFWQRERTFVDTSGRDSSFTQSPPTFGASNMTGIESSRNLRKDQVIQPGKDVVGEKARAQGGWAMVVVGIVRLMEQGTRGFAGRTLFRSFIRGVQILNRILDECISLTRLRPVTRRTRGRRELDEAEEEGGGVGSRRDNKSVLSSATMGRTERTERRV